jgi:hypothetical protein
MRLPRVLAGDKVHFAQNPDCASADIFQVPDGCRYNVKRAAHLSSAHSQDYDKNAE